MAQTIPVGVTSATMVTWGKGWAAGIRMRGWVTSNVRGILMGFQQRKEGGGRKARRGRERRRRRRTR
jgi:hypothetical protein